jgi:ABC-type bacteriocin/lantibiotic exporter with double-glycine peptidase domain
MKKRRVKLAEFLQMENAECGAASLKIILEYYGSYVRIETSRKAIGIGRDGSTAKQLIAAASSLGLTLVPLKVSFEEMISSVPPPFILFWDSNHWLTVEGFENEYLYVSDPARGNVRYTRDESVSKFSGLILVPNGFNSSLAKNENIDSNFHLNNIVTYFRKPIILSLLLALFSIIPEIAFALTIGLFTQQVATSSIDSAIISTAWFLFLITGIFTSFLFIRFLLLRLIYQKLFVNTSKRLMEKLVTAPLMFFSLRSLGDLGTRISSLTDLSLLSINVLLPGLFSITRSIIVAFLLLFIEWRLGLFIIFVLLTSSFVVLKNLSISLKDSAVNDIYSGTAFGILVDIFKSSELVKSTGSEIPFFQKWAAFYSMFITSSQGVSLINSNITTIIVISNYLLAMGILYFSAFLIMSGIIQIATYTAFLYMSTIVLEGLGQLPGLVSSFSRLSGFRWRLNDVLDIQEDKFSFISTALEKKHLNQLIDGHNYNLNAEPSIELHEVSFMYPGASKYTYHNVDFIFSSSTFNSIIGPSGSGKSTLVKNIVGLIPLSSGTIRICGISQDDLNPVDSHSVFSYVPQDSFLFEGSLLDNICLLDQSITQDTIDKTLEITNLREILNISSELDSFHIANRGANLSAGQKQIVELTRALVRNPKILVLDEATSGIDVNLERFIFEQISKLDVIIISIAHRNTALEFSDNILDLTLFT